mgnify:CR=1 FL=1
MSVMNTLTSIEITPVELINGKVVEYRIKIDSFVNLKNRDRVMITTPETVTFGRDSLSCYPVEPEPIGVTKASCERID